MGTVHNVAEDAIEVAGTPVFYRHAPADGTPALYLHSVPTSSDDWTALLARTGGLAPDLPGFGRSGKANNLEYSLAAYARFVESFLEAVAVDRVTLVGHGWGAAAALVYAQRHPDRVARLAILDAVPLLEGFRWPRPVSRWRRLGVGELMMGAVSRRVLARTLRAGAATPAAWPDSRVDAAWEQFDQGTQRAILRLHRSADPAALAAAGERLGALAMPTLVVWGERDPWLSPEWGDAYGRHLPGATVARIAGAGHWPWLDAPAVLDTLAAFVTAPAR